MDIKACAELIQGSKIMYVGQSVDIDARLAAHRERDFDSWHWIAHDRLELNAVERAYIETFFPPWNRDTRTQALRERLSRPPTPDEIELEIMGRLRRV